MSSDKTQMPLEKKKFFFLKNFFFCLMKPIKNNRMIDST